MTVNEILTLALTFVGSRYPSHIGEIKLEAKRIVYDYLEQGRVISCEVEVWCNKESNTYYFNLDYGNDGRLASLRIG